MTIEQPSRLEYMLRNPYATRAEVEQFCAWARGAKCRAVLAPGSRVMDCRHFLEDSEIKTVAQIGFPFGANDSDVKRYETEVAVDQGAEEIELMPSIARLKESDYKFVLREIRDVVDAADERVVKVVIEATLWSDPELTEIARMVLDSGGQYLSLTSTPLSADHFALVAKLRGLVGPNFGLKAAAHHESAVSELISGGADLIGLLAA